MTTTDTYEKIVTLVNEVQSWGAEVHNYHEGPREACFFIKYEAIPERINDICEFSRGDLQYLRKLDGVPRRGDVIDIFIFCVGILTTVCHVYLV